VEGRGLGLIVLSVERGAKVHSQNKSTMFRITESLLESSLLLLGIWVHTVNFDDGRALCQVGGDNDRHIHQFANVLNLMTRSG